jgi:nucleotide-binding universal stress UspA family protein
MTSEPTVRTIVIGYLPTPEGLAAYEAGVAWALRTEARVVVVNTGHHGDFSHSSFASPQDLDAISAELTSAGLEHDVQQPTDGRSAAEALLSACADEDADLLVIGVRRRTPVGKALTGSTAQHVLLDAPCPVLAVKPR